MAKVLKKIRSDVGEETFGMKCTFGMKREDPRRKNRDCERMSGTECGKKGCKNQSSPESRNDSDRVQMATHCKKIIGKCDNVNQEKKHVSEIVRVLEIEHDAGSAGVFAVSTSVIMFVRITDVFDANNRCYHYVCWEYQYDYICWEYQCV